MSPRNPTDGSNVGTTMRQPGGIVPPGKAGLLMLAFALVPIVLKEAKPLVRAAGRGLRRLGEAVERVAESSQIDQQPAEASGAQEETPPTSTPSKAKKRKAKGS